VLDAQHVHLVDVQKIGCASIRGEVAFGDFESNARGICVMAAGVVHRDDESVRARQLFDQGVGQVRCERRDSAMARQVIPERRESPDVVRTHHALS
jgi:hypothetical protein